MLLVSVYSLPSYQASLASEGTLRFVAFLDVFKVFVK